MPAFPYDLVGPIGQHALGLIVLQMDETIEQDFRRLFPGGETAIYTTRIPSGASLNPDTIATMKTHLTATASLLPPAADFDAVGYACTSGTTLIGAQNVAELVRRGVRCAAVTDPLTAALAAFDRLGVRRIAIVSPYIPIVAEPIRAAFEAHGIAVVDTLSFGEESEARVARIAPASIHEAAVVAARTPGVEGVFLSCTNLRTLDIIAPLESALGLPVVSSNLALGWHMAELAGIKIGGGIGSMLETRGQ